MSKRNLVIVTAMAILVASSTAHAGMCKDEMERYDRDVANDPDTLPKTKKYMQENIRKGCLPGGFYEQLDEAIRQAAAICKAHPEKQGCQGNTQQKGAH